MDRGRTLLALLAFLSCSFGLLAAAALMAQTSSALADPASIRSAMKQAEAEAAEASARGAELEQAARIATQEAEKTAKQSAALAARVQQAEAKIGVAEGRILLIGEQRQQLSKRLAQRREPLVRLTGALQKFARRPLGLSVLRPGSLRETVYLRAILETTIPQVRSRTAALRAEIDRGRELQAQARQALAALESQQRELGDRRQSLAALETRQRLNSRKRNGDAARETEKALALAEEARDLGTLIGRLDQAGSLRDELAALPGPILRPSAPSDAVVAPQVIASSTAAASRLAPAGLQLPVTGGTLYGFGAITDGGVRSEGVTLAPREGAQVIAPAAGRVAFAGPYRGFGRIVIIEHGAGWTSLITGLARTDVDVGEEVIGGAPLGVAGVERPQVSLELRRDGQPVNPLDYVG